MRAALLAVLVAGLVAALALFAGPRATVPDGAEAPEAPALPVVSGIVAHAEGYVVEERYLGRVRARRTSAPGFERAGRVVEVMVDEGDRVAAGQALARLDTEALEAARRTAEATLATSRSAARVAAGALALAQSTFERTQELRSSRNISEQRFDEAASALQIAREELAMAEAGVEEARARVSEAALAIGRSTLFAPFAGTVLARLADEGAVVAPGVPVLRIAETAALEVRAGLPASTAARLDPGRSYTVEVGGIRVQARLRTVVGALEAESRTLPAVFSLPDGVSAPVGGVASVVVETERPGRGFWVPVTALSPGRRGLWRALALVPDETAPDTYRLAPRELVMIHHEAGRAFVRGAFRDGERYVSTGLHRLVPGQRVRLP